MASGVHAVSKEFQQASEEDWLKLVEKTLKGKPFEKAMVRETADGLKVPALGMQTEMKPQAQPFRQEQNWLITSPNWAADAKQVNSDILTDLERGASAISLTIDTHGQGIKPTEMPNALDGVYLDLVPINIMAGEGFSKAAQQFAKLLEDKGHSEGGIKGCLGIDPIGTLARQGALNNTVENYLLEAAAIAQSWHANQPSITIFTADGTVVANAGGSEVDEISFAISCAVTYLRAMEKAGIALDTAARKIQFTFTASADLWLTVSKLRAARRVWQNILAACGVSGVPMHINAVSSVHAMTVYDPWVNILRGTAACFAAVVGGADIVMTLPHDLMKGTSDDFSRRIARNIQIILQEESNLGRVIDPAAGAYAVEKLTADMSAETLEAFKGLETNGGVLVALRDGGLAKAIAVKAEKRENAIRNRKQPLTGVSEFPNIQEELFPIPQYGEDMDTETVRQFAEEIEPLTMKRNAGMFEMLREISDRTVQDTGKRPTIFLANLGTPADFTARATFAKNFFEAGGIESIPGTGGLTASDISDQFKASGADIVVLCGQDAQYEDIGADIAQSLKRVGSKYTFIAGAQNWVEKIETIDDCIYLGADVIASVERAYKAIGIGVGGDKS